MAFESNGNWSSDFYPITDRDNSVPILASKFQTLIQSNLKQSFENCILRDGTGRPTANINWNGYKITNMADGTSNGDAVNKGQLEEATYDIATEQEAIAGTSDNTIMTPAKVKAALDNLATSTRFCVNGGYATSGKPDLLSGTSTATLSFKVDDGTLYRPLVATTASGSSFELSSVSTADVSGLTDGTYNVFIDSEGNSYVYANTIYRQPNQPNSMNTNDIWFNTCEPFSAYIKTASELVECDLVQIPQTVTVESNVVSEIKTIAFFNDNGAGNSRASDFEYMQEGFGIDWTSGVTFSNPYTTPFTAPSAGIAALFYRSNDRTSHVYINGAETNYMSQHSSVDNDNVTMTIPLSKGDVLTLEMSPTDAYSGVFYPYKGVI